MQGKAGQMCVITGAQAWGLWLGRRVSGGMKTVVFWSVPGQPSGSSGPGENHGRHLTWRGPLETDERDYGNGVDLA